MFCFAFSIALCLIRGLRTHDFNDISIASEIEISGDELFAIQEDVKKNSILLYDTEKPEEVKALIANVTNLCQCEVEDLPHIQVLVLHYSTASHDPATNFLQISGIALATEDNLVFPPSDELNVVQNFTVSRLRSKDDNNEENKDQSPPPPNDPFFRIQWGLDDSTIRKLLQLPSNDVDINWLEGQKRYEDDPVGGSEEGPSVVVAVIDSGVDYNHPDLKDAMWKNPGEIPDNGIDDDGNGIIDDVYGANFVRVPNTIFNPFGNLGNPEGDPLDKDLRSPMSIFGHGTMCAGIIAANANNGKGIAGVAGNTKGKVSIMALRAFGPLGAETSWLLKALDYAISKGAHISNNSYGFFEMPGDQAAPLSQVNEIYESILRKHPQHLFITAAGNRNVKVTRENEAPGCIDVSNHINVAASTYEDALRWEESNFGKPYVDVFAPGFAILSTFPLNNIVDASGTSFAAPHVSGLAALLMSMREEVSPKAAKKLIEKNVQLKTKLFDLVTSGGLIDVNATINALISAKPSGCKPDKKLLPNETCVDRCGCVTPRRGWSTSSQRCKKGRKTGPKEKCVDRCSCKSPETGWDPESKKCKRGSTTDPFAKCIDRCGCESPKQGWSTVSKRCKTGSRTNPREKCPEV